MANAERPHIQEVLVDSMGAAAASGHAAVEWSHFEQRCSFGSWRELDPCLEARLPLSGWHCAAGLRKEAIVGKPRKCPGMATPPGPAPHAASVLSLPPIPC